LCNRAIQSGDITVYEDTWEVKAIEDNPFLKGAAPVRFYAAAPIITAESFNIGVVCILDFKPRSFAMEKLKHLQVVAAMVKRELEKRLEVLE
jgi:GAF domain-containing protein